jgi:outer membrane protein OmpA-like peptidoglycan-associated protein
MSNGKKPESPWVGLLQNAATTLMPVLLTGASLIGFVAFAGAVIVWTRFSAAQVPADQAVAALPQIELVAVGSSVLLLFGFFGALAALAVYLIDRGGRTTPGMSRGLLLLLMVEGVAAIVLVDGPSMVKSAVAIELFLLPMVVVLWSTFASPFIKLETDLPKREEGEPEAEIEDGPFLHVEAEDLWVSRRRLAELLGLAAGFGLGAAILVRGVFGGSGMTAALVGLAAVAAALALVVGLSCNRFYVDKNKREEVLKQAREAEQEAEKADRAKERQLETELRHEGRWPEAAVLGRERKAKEAQENPNDEKPKPPRLDLTGHGKVLMVAMTAVAVIAPSWLLDKVWLAVALVAALVLLAGLWRIAALAEAKFMWYGLAVFISVPLFGTLTTMARNLDDPQVQPVALIRSTDGPDEAIQGLFVTETDKRVYFASVTTEGCGHELVPHSGRLLWVPRSEVVAMSIGPSQSVDQAERSSLEMAETLTPAAESPHGARPGAPVAGQAPPSPAPGPAPVSRDTRLEHVGAAVSRNFGTGLSLEPEDAAPGDVATLRMSAPDREDGMHGFGESRGNRSLRLGGIEVDISKEETREAANAEFVKIGGGAALKLRKGVVYTKVGGEYVEAEKNTDPAEGEGRFVKVEDPAVVRVDDGRLATGVYLRLDGNDGLMRVPRGARGTSGLISELVALVGRPFDLAAAAIWGASPPRGKALGPQPVAIMRGGRELPLEYGLWRQAWHEDHIRFKVPAHATTGPVTIECDPTAGRPYLRIHRPPTAHITVRMMAGTGLISFDSRRSSDRGGRVESRHWTVSGLPAGSEPLMERRLPPRFAPYRIRLTVSDNEQERGSAELHLLRLPASFFGFNSPRPEHRNPVRMTKRALLRVGREALPAAIEIDGNADNVGLPSYNRKLSLERAENVRDELLTPAMAGRLGITQNEVPVRTRGFGESCPLKPGGGRLRANRRVEVFVLGRGADVAVPKGCHSGRAEHTRW